MHHELEQPSYAPDALEPAIPRAWVEGQLAVQRECHERLGLLLSGTPWATVEIEDILRRVHEFPADQREPVRAAAAGYLNHTLLLNELDPDDGGGEPNYELLDLIESTFGSFPEYQAATRTSVNELQGEGWVWLVWDGRGIGLLSTQGETNPHESHRAPLLGIDLFEHARGSHPDRDSYLHALWKVIDWRVVAERLLEAQESTREHKPL